MGPAALSSERVGAVPEALRAKNRPAQSAFELREEPIHTRRPIRVVCLGAGYSGVLMGIIWSQRMAGRNADFTIYERNHDLGGTWLENR